jgi:hypothetical protein
MPLNNNFYGIYKVATIKTNSPTSGIGKNPYIIEKLDVKDAMDVSAKFFMQGTPLTKILDIGKTTEDITVNAPILVPTSLTQTPYLQDGLQLLNDLVSLQYPNGIAQPSNSLPIMTKASIRIGVDASSVNFTLKSDGDPNNATNVFQINPGTSNLVNQIGLANASRVAKYYDFFVNLGGINYYVEDATININIKTEDKTFLGVYNASNPGHVVVPDDGTNNGIWPGGLDSTYSGWQFPFVLVGGIEITVSGKAAISIDNTTGAAVNFNYSPSTTTSTGQQPFVSPPPTGTLLGNSNVTLQPSGLLNAPAQNFNIYFTGSQNYSGVLPSAFAVNRAVINSHTSNFSKDQMTVDFEVKAYVGVN